MNIIKTISTYLLALLFLAGAWAHIMKPEISDGFIPDLFNKTVVHTGAAIAELMAGVGMLIKKWRKHAAFMIILMLLVFLPLHVMDIFKEVPVIGSKTAAYIRVPVQLLFIGMAWLVYKNE
jgi:uncharacterized membrane protein